MEIPYRVINLVQNDKSGAYETRIKLTVQVTGNSGAQVLEKEEAHPVSITKDMLEKLGKSLTIAFPFQLPPGKYSAKVTLENTVDRSLIQKDIKFKLY